MSTLAIDFEPQSTDMLSSPFTRRIFDEIIGEIINEPTM